MSIGIIFLKKLASTSGVQIGGGRCDGTRQLPGVYMGSAYPIKNLNIERRLLVDGAGMYSRTYKELAQGRNIPLQTSD